MRAEAAAATRDAVAAEAAVRARFAEQVLPLFPRPSLSDAALSGARFPLTLFPSHRDVLFSYSSVRRRRPGIEKNKIKNQ